MKVICIDKGDNNYLTIGKSYEVVREMQVDWDNETKCYSIIDDSGDLWNYHAYRFTSKQHIRNEKLNQLW